MKYDLQTLYWQNVTLLPSAGELTHILKSQSYKVDRVDTDSQASLIVPGPVPDEDQTGFKYEL